mmetsp:Transcript_21375/g.46901  ORF Transcript_21375/g.46901 Transcript_21375/m.46901 type:complete len:204 (-) Transcript_21375:2888-3499(-)
MLRVCAPRCTRRAGALASVASSPGSIRLTVSMFTRICAPFATPSIALAVLSTLPTYCTRFVFGWIRVASTMPVCTPIRTRRPLKASHVSCLFTSTILAFHLVACRRSCTATHQRTASCALWNATWKLSPSVSSSNPWNSGMVRLISASCRPSAACMSWGYWSHSDVLPSMSVTTIVTYWPTTGGLRYIICSCQKPLTTSLFLK